jgi:hypothetical protein
MANPQTLAPLNAVLLRTSPDLRASRERPVATPAQARVIHGLRVA